MDVDLWKFQSPQVSKRHNNANIMFVIHTRTKIRQLTIDGV